MRQKKEKPVLNKKIIAAGCLFMLPAFVIIIFTMLIPLIWNVVLSFYEWNGNSEMKFVGLANYISAMTERSTLTALKNSVFIGVVSTVVAMILGILLALCIYRLGRKEGALCRFIFYSPSMMPMTVIGLLFVFVPAQDNGLLNSALKAAGLTSLQHGWLSERGTVLWTISIVQGWRFSGTIMMLCYTGMLAIPGSLFESAKLDGAGYMKSVRLIILPLIKPTIKLALSMMLLWSFKTYDMVWTMTKGGPGDLSVTAPIRMITTAFSFNKFGNASAIGIILTIIVSICVIIGRRIAKGETYEY